MIIGIVLLEVILIIALVAYNLHTNNNLKLVKKSKKKMNKLYIMKEIIEITSSSLSVMDKMEKLNNLLLTKLNVEYSTIVHFNGINYIIKITNVPEQDKEEILKMQLLDIYKTSIKNNDIKYLTLEDKESKLLYTDVNVRQAKSSIFLPFLKDNMYLGYWVIESQQLHAFDSIDVEILNILRDAMLDTILTLGYESALENMVRDDKYSNMKSFEYMLTEGKRKLDETVISQLAMIKILNIEEINQKCTRQGGNKVIEQISKKIYEELVKQIQDTIYVRYMGPIFLLAFPNKQKHQIEQILKEFKEKIEQTEVLKIKTGIIINEGNEVNEEQFQNKEEIEEEIEEEKQAITSTLEEIIESESENKNKDENEDKIEKELKKRKVKTKEKEDTEKDDIEIIDREQVKVNIVVTSYYKNTALDIISKKLEDYIEQNEYSNENIYI